MTHTYTYYYIMYPQNVPDNLAKKIQKALLSANALRDRPMTEQQLADRFGVSRSPIRDALKGLEKGGIIERRKKKGIYLKAHSVTDMLALYDVRSALEGFAARLAAEGARPKDLAQLRLLARKCQELLRERKDFEKSQEVDTAFHKRIIQLSGNPWLASIMENFHILRRVFRLNHMDHPFSRPSSSPYSHEKLVEALERGNGDECERLFRAHVQWAKQGLIKESLGVRLNLLNSSATSPVK
ncbi:MAG: FCD domain-containing protein [Actinobacteria bacterium]|nr:FCD domain-containing protein [Actinomycetota bacterium]